MTVLVTIAVLLAGDLIAPFIALAWVAATRTPWSAIGFVRWPHWLRESIVAALGGVALKVLLKTVVLPPLGLPAENATYHFLVGNAAALPRMLFIVVVTAGVGEEIVWRGFLFDRLRAWLGDARGARVAIVAISSVLFGFAHLHDQGWPGVVQAIMTGTVFGTTFMMLRRIWPVMVAHAAFDVAAVFMIYANREEWFAHLLWP